MNDDQQWLELPAGIVKLEGVLWIRERDNISLTDVAQSFREGRYNKPFIHDDGEMRRLHFNLESTQSEMWVEQENELVFDYTKEMMSFLLFNPAPKHVVIIGLGGGSMTKFCFQHLPETKITTVENDENVIGLSPLFEVPPASHRNAILHTDAADYFKTLKQPVDVVLIDGCDAEGTAAVFFEPDFYDNLRRGLTPDGLIVVNLVGNEQRKPELVKTLSQCFGRAPVGTELDDEKNRLMFAFNPGLWQPDWSEIKLQAKALKRDLGLDFPHYAKKLQSAWPQP